jgi:hypothetical protein
MRAQGAASEGSLAASPSDNGFINGSGTSLPDDPPSVITRPMVTAIDALAEGAA